MNERELTERQKHDIRNARRHILVVRGMQCAVIGLGVYLAAYEKRGIAAVVIAVGIAICYQFAAMPVLPGWMNRHRPKDED